MDYAYGDTVDSLDSSHGCHNIITAGMPEWYGQK